MNKHDDIVHLLLSFVARSYLDVVRLLVPFHTFQSRNYLYGNATIKLSRFSPIYFRMISIIITIRSVATSATRVPEDDDKHNSKVAPSRKRALLGHERYNKKVTCSSILKQSDITCHGSQSHALICPNSVRATCCYGHVNTATIEYNE
jgi:hypothetical protein